MDDTFALSNMCPQVGEGFNRDYWAHFEDFCRRLTNHYPSVRIVTGPLYLPKRDADGKWRVSYEVIGQPPNVAVPTHFYKVIFAEDGKPNGQVSLGAFVLPNAKIPNDKPLTDFEVPVEAIERYCLSLFLSLLFPFYQSRRISSSQSLTFTLQSLWSRIRLSAARRPEKTTLQRRRLLAHRPRLLGQAEEPQGSSAAQEGALVVFLSVGRLNPLY